MFEYIKELCSLNGTSGRENKIRDYIISELGDVPYNVDNMGNLLVSVKGKKRAAKKVMVCAHMDEVGFIATYITPSGLIKFTTVGGIMPAVIAGKRVVFENGTYGVIGIKPVHLSTEEEKNKYPETDSLFIDIGAESGEEAAEKISAGDTAVFASPYVDMGDKILSKALDDRIGCAVMLDMIKKGVEYDTLFAFTVQEEVGLRGAGCAAFTLRPDYALILESTTASDIIDVPEESQVCVQGKGAVLSFMDNGTLYDKDMFDHLLELGKENGIPVQVKSRVAGGNDAGAVHKTAGGIRTAAISVPCRYIHSASSVCDKGDIEAVASLAGTATAYFSENG